METSGAADGFRDRERIMPGSPMPLGAPMPLDAPMPLGATLADGGVNFAVASDVARTVTLCLFDDDDIETRVPLTAVDDGVWHGFVRGVGVGTRYGYRVDGPFAPSRGERANPAKLLLDPYARAFTGRVRGDEELLDHALGDPSRASPLDSAPYVPRSLVVAPAARAMPTGTPWRRHLADTVVYEVHVEGFTARHPGVPPGLRGTYAGFVHDAALEHLVGLGVTSVELLPVFESVTEPALARRGHTNYWGYNTIGFFAPHGAYSAAVRSGRVGGQVDEFRMMVERLHAAGLEVILDVVYNHTAEGDAVGPTLSLRGLDNAAYYRLEPSDPSAYVDTTGTGNSVRADHPRALRLIMDSLRYWIEEMGVDGFRFDLAATLARDHDVFDRESAFLDAVAQDPVVSQVKLIAEPWDVGRPDSYGLGRFPAPWAEWNGAYRDCVRDFWRSRDGMLGEFAGRLTGSADLYGSPPGRSPGSVNFVTAHDGFTLRDLVSYDVKHNETNGEGNRDGTDDNRSWNCGVEGATDDPVVLALRARQSRALLATLVCSFGVPMLAGGDELGRTQLGNNNAYCHDDELVWFDWDDVDTDLLRFVRALLAWRQRHPVFRRRRSLGGPAVTGIDWFAADGARMAPAGWSDPSARSVTLFLDGSQGVGEDDGSAVDDDFLVVVNAWWEPLEVVIPDTGAAREWRTALDTFSGQVVDDAPGPMGPDATARLSAGERRSVGARSLVVLTTG